MKLLMLFADNFEDVEAIATYDVLSRGKIEVDACSVMPNNKVHMKCGHDIFVKYNIKDIIKEEYDGLIIPGGPASFTILNNMKVVDDLIRYFVDSNKLVSAICAAPHLVGRLGYLKNRNYTVHPGFEDQIIGGKYLRDKGVVVDGNFITAKSMYYSIEFGLAIFEYFTDKSRRDVLEKSLQGEK